MILGAAAAVVSARVAVALAERIGPTLQASGGGLWFAGLLGALLDMWDDLGPPGQFGLLALGLTMMLLPGTMIVFGGISVAAAGVIGATTVVVPAAVGTAGAVVTGTAIGLAMVDAADPGVGSSPDDAEQAGGARSNGDPPASPTNEVATSVGPKISQQMEPRGWTRDMIDDTMAKPARTEVTRDTRWTAAGTKLDDPATAFVRGDGSYVVRNDVTGDIVQVSNRNDMNWIAPWG